MSSSVNVPPPMAGGALAPGGTEHVRPGPLDLELLSWRVRIEQPLGGNSEGAMERQARGAIEVFIRHRGAFYEQPGTIASRKIIEQPGTIISRKLIEQPGTHSELKLAQIHPSTCPILRYPARE